MAFDTQNHSSSASMAELHNRVASLEALVTSLRARQQRSALFFERSVMGILLGDAAGNLLDANPRALELLGYTLADLCRTNIREIVHPEEQRAIPVQTGPEAALAGRPFTAERRYKRADGTWLPVQVDCSPLDDSGNLFQIMIQDITARRNAEKAKNDALRQAQTANQAKSAFLGNMSHEIRTPLNGVMGMLQLLLATEHTAEQDEYLNTAMASAAALLRLLTDILEISQLDSQTIVLTDTEFTLSEVLDPVLASFSHEASIKGLSLSCQVAVETPSRLRGDPARLRQILYNLAANAIKYTSAGQVGLSVAPAPPCTDGASAITLEFVVTDTGIGIPPEKQQQVFDAFAQADATVTRVHGGPGLGLTIARAITERMGGSIRLSSREREGTEVRIRLPLTLPPGETRSCPPSALPCLSGQRVLVVEDEAINRLTIRAMLERLGCVVTLAENGEAGIARLGQELFDCVLMDIQMPVMDGLTATRAIRNGAAGTRNQQTPILGLTAHALAENRNQALAAGMSGYVVKPVDMEHLARAMGQVLTDCRDTTL